MATSASLSSKRAAFGGSVAQLRPAAAGRCSAAPRLSPQAAGKDAIPLPPASIHHSVESVAPAPLFSLAAAARSEGALGVLPRSPALGGVVARRAFYERAESRPWRLAGASLVGVAVAAGAAGAALAGLMATKPEPEAKTLKEILPPNPSDLLKNIACAPPPAAPPRRLFCLATAILRPPRLSSARLVPACCLYSSQLPVLFWQQIPRGVQHRVPGHENHAEEGARAAPSAAFHGSGQSYLFF